MTTPNTPTLPTMHRSAPARAAGTALLCLGLWSCAATPPPLPFRGPECGPAPAAGAASSAMSAPELRNRNTAIKTTP